MILATCGSFLQGATIPYLKECTAIAMDVDHDGFVTLNDEQFIMDYYLGRNEIKQDVSAADVKVLNEAELTNEVSGKYVKEVQELTKFKTSGYSFYWDGEYEAYRLKIQGEKSVDEVKAALKGETEIYDYDTDQKLTIGTVDMDDYLVISYKVSDSYIVNLVMAYIEIIE